MTMMDTRVGAPGADIPDDDLDFAVAVKLRLDRGEDVPDEDLDRAVAIKLRLAPAAPPALAPTSPTTMGPGGMQPYPRVQLPAPTPEQDAANQAQLLKELEARYGPAPQPAAEGPNPSNVSLGEGGYTPPAPPQRGILAEAANAFQAGAQSLEAGIGQAGAALGDVLARTGSPALGGQLQQGRSGGIVEPAGAPSVLPEGTNPFYALAYKGTRMVAGMAPGAAVGIAGGAAVGGMAGLLAGAAPLSVAAGGHTYQAAVDAGIDQNRAMNAGLASAAVAQVAGSTQLGIILRKFPWLQQGVQNLVERRVAAYLAERGAEATFNGLVGVAQQAAMDSIQVAHGINPAAFDAFWTEQAPEAFAGGALPTAVMGLGHDALRLPGAIAENRQAARTAADVQQAQDFARQTAEGQNLPYPAVQQRVEGPPAPVQGTSLRTPPPPAEAGPAAATSSAAGNPDQPPARDPGATAGGEDPYAAIDALRARMAGPPPAEPPAEPATSSTTTPPPAEPPPPPARQYPQRAPQRPAAPGPRPDLGSSRLNIPLSPEMEAERAQQTVQQNVSAWQREKANRDRPVPLPKVEPATEPPQASAPPQAPESAGAAEGDRTSPPPPQPGESQQTLDGQGGEGKASAEDTTPPAPHPAASDQRERVHQEVRAAFGEQGAEALPLLDAYARSWTASTGRPAGEFYGRFSFEKGGGDGDGMKQAGESWYYSAAQKAVEAFKDPKARMTGEQWEKWLRAQPGIKPEEMDYLGLSAAPGKMTPQEAAAWIDTNRIKVEETVLGDFTASWEQAKAAAKKAGASEEEFRGAYGKYRHWNHDNEPFPWEDYHPALREIIQPLAEKRQGGSESKFETYQTPGGTGYRELLLRLPERSEQPSDRPPLTPEEWEQSEEFGVNFRGRHFDQPNVLAHVRFNERTDADGKRVLFLEEIQSDWHQKGRKQGYKPDFDPAAAHADRSRFYSGKGDMPDAEWAALSARVRAYDAADKSVPDAPFKTTWPMLAFKRMMAWAVENGYDRIAWTTGDMQAERYDLSKQISRLGVQRLDSGHLKGQYAVTAHDMGGTEVLNDAYPADKLEDVIGKEMAKRVVEDLGASTTKNPSKSYRGLDLKVGGEGMKGFYDQILPAEVNKLVKKMGGRVGQTEIAEPNKVDMPNYSGPELTLYQLASAIDQPNLSRQAAEGLNAVEQAMKDRGWSFNRAMATFGNEEAAKSVGGVYSRPKDKTRQVHALDITPGIREAVGKGLPLFQDAGKGNKGSYRLLEDGRAIIRALDNPDASTLPHELGHAFLDFLHEIDPKLHADAMKALGAAGETPTVENHERWSRAFEAYLREGKAPTSLLRATFEKFKSWLRDIYRTISRGPLAKKLTPALRQVFDQMLSRGDQPSEPAPAPKVREVGKRRTAPVERREWSKADIADRIQRKYENSPSYDADLSQEHVEGDLGGFTRFSGKIPGELLNELEGRPDLLKMLQPNSPAGTAGGADALAQLGAEGYVRRLTRWQQGQTKDTIAKLRRNIADPEAAFLADLWESTPKGGGKPKETVRAEDLAERGLRFTIDDRPASIIQKSGDLYLRVKDLGTYPLVAFDEVPVDKGSLAKGAGGKEMFQAAQDDRRDRPPTPPTSKLVDVAAYLATNQARLKRRGGGRVDNRTAAAALDRFLGHGKYGSELPEKVRGMANRMLARSLNKYGFTDPAALEARVGKAFRAAEIADRRAARPSRLQKALDQANGVRPEPTTQDAVDRAVAIERAHAEVGTAMQVRKAELAGEKKVAKLKDLLSEKGLQAAREMAAQRRAARQQLIDQADRFRVKYLKAKLGGEEAGSKTGYKAGQADLQAMREEAADLVLKGLPRGERGRSSILKAIRNATRQRDVYRLMEEVQHRAVSARAGEAWKQIRKLTRRKNLSALPEKAEDILGIADGENVREGVRKLLAQATAAQQTAKYQRAEPLRLARLINRRAAERAIFKDPASTPLQKALARDTIRAINEKIRNERPDLQPKVDAARRLGEIENEIRETTTKVKNADAMWISNERRAARGMRKFMLARIGATTKIASAAGETKPGVSEGSNQSMARQAVFLNWTPDTLGQWLDNAIGKPEQAQFGHHLVFREPLRAAGMVAEEKVARLAALEELAKRHGFESWDHATAVISGTHGGGLQQTVDIDVPGWVDKRITMGEALKIFGDDQDAQTRQLSDDGMVHRLARRRDGHVAALEAGERAQIIQAIPQRFRDFYTELKELKEKMLGNRALEIRRRYRGTAPDTVPNREPRVREGDSDYVSDYFDSKSQSRSLLEQSFMKDRVQTPGPVNLVVDGLEGHMRDWDSQLHLIHHADLAYAMSKTLLHKDTLKALAVQGGEQAVERIQTLVDRILGTEIKGKSTAVDRAARVLRKNVGAGTTALSPKSFLKQFAVFPLLASLHPVEAIKAAGGLAKKGLRERVMKANGLLAQRFHMADAAKAASAGMSNPIFDSGDFKLRVKAGLANLKDAAAQAGSGQIRNATKNTLRALGNFRDATTNLLRFNSWADEQGVKAAFLICEQLVDREHPNLNPADRERMIGLKTAEMVHRTMNTYDTLGQSFWRSDLDQKGAAGMLNMFSNDSTKQSNLAYQAMASRDKGLIARTFSGLALGAAYSVIAPALLSQGGAAVLRYFFGDSDSDTERRKSLRDRLAWTSTRELAGKIPIAGADLLADIGKLLVQGKGDVASTNSPAMQQVAALLRESSLAIYNTATNQADPEKSTLQNFEAQAAKSERARAAIGGAVRAGGTVAGVGAMPLVNLLREMKPNAEVYGLAANWARRGDEDKAAALLAGQVEAMRKAEIPEREIKDHLVEVVASRLNRDVEKDDEAGRRESDRTARRVVSAALSR